MNKDLVRSKNGILFNGIIADGLHISSATQKLTHLLNPDGTILVTDTISAFGCGDGDYKIGHQNVSVKNNMATVPGTTVLAGSLASMPDCIRNFANSINHGAYIDSLKFAIKAATYNPALFLNVADRKGDFIGSLGSDARFRCSLVA